MSIVPDPRVVPDGTKPYHAPVRSRLRLAGALLPFLAEPFLAEPFLVEPFLRATGHLSSRQESVGTIEAEKEAREIECPGEVIRFMTDIGETQA